MNYFVPHEFDPSSQNHGSYDQFTYNSSSYSYSYPNPQFTSSIHPYSYQNPYVQPSQHEEQEPNPPGVTPPPPLPEMCRNSYYQYQAHGAAAGVPIVAPHPAPVDAGVQTIVQPLYGGVGVMDGIVPRGDPHPYLGPKLNVASSAFRVDGFDIGHSLPMNAATPFQDHSATAYGGIHIQGGPCQPLSQSIGEPHHGPRPKVSGRTYHARGRGKGSRKHAVAPAQDRKLLFQGKSEIQGAASLPMVQSGASSIGQTVLPLQGPAQSAASISPSPKVVSCELCKVECNTLEVLQQHVNGKKHKKKLKAFEELQNLNKKVISGQADQTPTIELKSEVVSQPDQAEGSGNQQLEQEVLPSQEINEESKVVGEKRKEEEVERPEESTKKTRVDRSQHIGRGGFKHKMRGGKSNRKMRPSDRPKILVQPPKPKEVTPLVCELCNVKCESLPVFQSHLAGKKHKSKANHFLSQERFGQELPQAQRPATMQGFNAYHVASAQNVDNMTSGVVDPGPLVTNAGASFLVTTAAGGTWNEGRSETGAHNHYSSAEMVGVAAGSEQAVTCGTTLDGGSSSEQNVVSTIQPPTN